MTAGHHRAAVIGIWVLVAAIAVFDVGVWIASGMSLRVATVALGLLDWLLLVFLGVLATRGIGRLSAALDGAQDAHRSTRKEVEQLEVRNDVLRTLAHSVDVPLAFLTLARRISPLVPCDRMGLALLTELDGSEFQTYTARVTEEERRSHPRPEVVFKMEGTAIGAAVRSRAPLVIADTSAVAAEYLDVNLLHSSGFASAVILPLISETRAVGTLNVVSRTRDAFTPTHLDTLRPITEILAVAFVAQQLQARATRQQTMEALSQQAAAVLDEIGSSARAIAHQSRGIEAATSDRACEQGMQRIAGLAERIGGALDRLRALAARDESRG